MTEYEAATLATRYAALVIAALLGSTQCALIWIGLRFMRRSAELRDKGLEKQGEASERRHNEAMKAEADRHAEAMQAGERQERESDRRHNEAMAAGERRERESLRRHEEAMAALDAQRKGMETLIERTAPPPPRA